jgi:hypothetical protein
MEHPFLSSVNLTDKSNEELQKIITDLNSKLNFAYRMRNQPMVNQLLMLKESYDNAYRKRMDDLMAKDKVATAIRVEK